MLSVRVANQYPVQVSVYQYVRILPVQGTVGPYGSNAIVKGIAAVRKIDFSFFLILKFMLQTKMMSNNKSTRVQMKRSLLLTRNAVMMTWILNSRI